MNTDQVSSSLIPMLQSFNLSDQQAEGKASPSLLPLHTDILVLIAASLPLEDLGRLATVSKQWRNIVLRPELWKPIADQFAKELGIAWNKDVDPKEEIKAYCSIRKPKDKLTSIHAFVANILGPRGFLNLPLLTLNKNRGPTDYIDDVEPDDMSAPLMRGVDQGRPFIAFRYIDSKAKSFPDKPKVIVAFQRRLNENLIMTGSSCPGEMFYPTTQLTETNLEYFTRLIKGEPCGHLGDIYINGQLSVRETEQSVTKLV